MMFPYCKENDAIFHYEGLDKYLGKADLSLGGGIVFFGCPEILPDMKPWVTNLTKLPYTPNLHDTMFCRLWPMIMTYFNSYFPVYVVPTQPTVEDYQKYVIPALLEKRPSVGVMLYDGVGRGRDYLYEQCSDFLTLFAAVGNQAEATPGVVDKYVLGVSGSTLQGEPVPRNDIAPSKAITCTALTPIYVPYTNYAVSPCKLEQSCAGASKAALLEYVRKCYIKQHLDKDISCTKSEIYIQSSSKDVHTPGWDDVTGSGLYTLPAPGVAVEFEVGESKLLVTAGGETKIVQMDTTAFLKNDRFFLPARFLGEALGHEVKYIPADGVYKDRAQIIKE